MSLEKVQKVTEKGDFEILLGSGVECHYSFPELSGKVSQQHAAIRRLDDRLFIKDLSSTQGTYVNGKKIRSKWNEITLHDHVQIGEISLEIRPTLLLGRERVDLTAQNLFLSFKSKKTPPANASTDHTDKAKENIVCDNISLSAGPGTLTGIMGPSGAGKTVLLNLLSGYLQPQSGIVRVGSFDVHKSFGLIKDIIGYIPQDDTLICDLTVQKSLHYCLHLRYPDMTFKVRQRLIENVLERMGFGKERLPRLLNSRIGSPEERGISGGERKRINIAHELVRNPLLLFLDEPTSGLSTVDSEQVIRLLKDICTTNQVTMLMTIHQPSQLIFNQLDQLVLMNRGGRLAYFGDTKHVVPYFEEITKKELNGQNPAEYVLRVLDEWDELNIGESPGAAFERHRHKLQLNNGEKTDAIVEQNPETSRKSKRKQPSALHQYFLLIRRNLSIKWTDKTSLYLMGLQAVIIAILLVFTFQGYQKDTTGVDQFSKLWHDFRGRLEKARENNQSIVLERSLRESRKWSDTVHDVFSEHTGYRKAAILFLIVASALWFGVVNGSREIVSERAVLNREAKSYLRLGPYLLAKFSVLALFSALQTAILLLIAKIFLLSSIAFISCWIILLLTAMAGSALSLMISAAVKTPQASLATVPIIIIPQLLIGGLLRPIKHISDQLAPGVRVSDLILQKWAFRQILTVDSTSGQNYLIQKVTMVNDQFLDFLDFDTAVLKELFFDTSSSDSTLIGMAWDPIALSMIAAHMMIPLIAAWIILRKKYG